MAERVVKVRLSAQVEEYRKGMLEAANATRTVGTEAEKLTQQRQSFELLGRTAAVAGGAIVLGLGAAVAKAAEFDEAMSFVQAATHESAENMGLLRDAAIEAGAATVFSATESANAIEELAKAGLTTADILSGGLAGSLDLAAAGGLGVAEAAGIAATTLQQFRLEGDQTSHVADLLAAGAGKAMGDVTDLSGALNQAGLVASQFDISVEETVGTLSAFASAGMLGSDAGTSMRAMLLRLANPTNEVKDLMAELGIEAYDAQGDFIGLSGLAGELETSLAGMTSAQRDQTLAMVFGQDAIRGANILLREGKDGIEDWTAAVDDQGYAAETAAIRLDNMKGDIEALGGAVDAAMIGMGEAADGPARFFIQVITEMVDGFNEMPSAGQQAVFWVGAVGGAALLAGGLFLGAVPKVVEYRAAIATLGVGAQRTSRALATLGRAAGVGAALGAAVWGVDALAKVISEELGPSAEEVDNKLRVAKSGVDLFAAALMSQGMQNTDQAAKLLANLGGELDEVAKSDFWNPRETSSTATVLAKQLAELAESDIDAASAQMRQLAEDADLTDEQMLTFINTNGELKDALLKTAEASGGAATDQDLLNIAMGEAASVTPTAAEAYMMVADEAASATDEVLGLLTAINELNGSAQDSVTANANWLSALEGISAEVASQKAAFEEANGTLDGFGLSLNEATAGGAENAAMLADVAAAAQDAAEAQYEYDLTTMSGQEATDKYVATLEAQRQAFIDSAVEAGFNADEVQGLADKIFALPDEKAIAVLAETADAQSAVDNLISWNDGRTITLNVETGETGVKFGNGRVAFANARGGLYDYAFANGGGIDTGIFSGSQGPLYKFAEPETGWESFISGKPSERERNIGIWQETGQRLGVDAGGGSSSTTHVNVTVMAGPGDSADALGNKIASKVAFRLGGR